MQSLRVSSLQRHQSGASRLTASLNSGSVKIESTPICNGPYESSARELVIRLGGWRVRTKADEALNANANANGDSPTMPASSSNPGSDLNFDAFGNITSISSSNTNSGNFDAVGTVTSISSTNFDAFGCHDISCTSRRSHIHTPHHLVISRIKMIN